MNQVNLLTKAGAIFWLSLIGYCSLFGAFYYNTQHTYQILDLIVRSNSMVDLGRKACEQMKGCTGITFLPYLVINNDTHKYIMQVAIQTKKPTNVDYIILKSIFDESKAEWPQYLSRKIDSIQIVSINGQNIQTKSEKRPEWYLSFIAKLGF
ncbi:MAG: hypothetical protein WCG35_04115 [Betaproteobacteria bacterium]